MGLIYKRQSLTGPNFNGVANFGKIADTEYDGYAVSTSDTNDLPNGPCDALVATVAGNISVLFSRTNAEGNVSVLGTTTLTSVAAGEILPIQVSRVRATSTTATGIFALYRK
jgi:hypothetical protein